ESRDAADDLAPIAHHVPLPCGARRGQNARGREWVAARVQHVHLQRLAKAAGSLERVAILAVRGAMRDTGEQQAIAAGAAVLAEILQQVLQDFWLCEIVAQLAGASARVRTNSSRSPTVSQYACTQPRLSGPFSEQISPSIRCHNSAATK